MLLYNSGDNVTIKMEAQETSVLEMANRNEKKARKLEKWLGIPKFPIPNMKEFEQMEAKIEKEADDSPFLAILVSFTYMNTSNVTRNYPRQLCYSFI